MMLILRCFESKYGPNVQKIYATSAFRTHMHTEHGKLVITLQQNNYEFSALLHGIKIRWAKLLIHNSTITMEINALSLPPATKFGQGYIFTGVCHSAKGGVSAPGGCLLPGRGVCSRGVCLLPGGVSAPRGGACSWGVPGGDPPPPGTATAAGGTHPTGMHSCWNCILYCIIFLT